MSRRAARVSIELLRHDDLVRTPWKNGGGQTAEIAVHPAGVGLADFDWRISIADVETAGAFSRFPGIDRTLTIIQGEGIVLTVGDTAVRLDRAGPPHRFDGDAASSAVLRAGAVRDLNVMTRRDRFAHAVTRLDAGDASVDIRGSEACAVLSLDGSARIEAGGATWRLEPLDTLLARGFAGAIRCAVERSALLVRIYPVSKEVR